MVFTVRSKKHQKSKSLIKIVKLIIPFYKPIFITNALTQILAAVMFEHATFTLKPFPIVLPFVCTTDDNICGTAVFTSPTPVLIDDFCMVWINCYSLERDVE